MGALILAGPPGNSVSLAPARASRSRSRIRNMGTQNANINPPSTLPTFDQVNISITPALLPVSAPPGLKFNIMSVISYCCVSLAVLNITGFPTHMMSYLN